MRDGVPHFVDGGAVRLRPLQKAAVGADDLRQLIACHTQERMVREDHGVVGQIRIGDDHWHACRRYGGKKDVVPMVGDLMRAASNGCECTVGIHGI